MADPTFFSKTWDLKGSKLRKLKTGLDPNAKPNPLKNLGRTRCGQQRQRGRQRHEFEQTMNRPPNQRVQATGTWCDCDGRKTKSRATSAISTGLILPSESDERPSSNLVPAVKAAVKNLNISHPSGQKGDNKGPGEPSTIPAISFERWDKAPHLHQKRLLVFGNSSSSSGGWIRLTDPCLSK